MPVSKGRKAKLKKLGTLPSPIPQRLPTATHKTLWETIRDHPVPWAICLVAAVIAIGEAVHQVFVEPDIYFEGDADISAPLSAPFTVKNRSWFFLMTESRLNCHFDQLTADDLKFGVVNMSSGPITIRPLDTDGFRCRVGSLANDLMRFETSRIQVAHVWLSVSYATFGWSRTSTPYEFTWYTRATPPRWIRGKIAD